MAWLGQTIHYTDHEYVYLPVCSPHHALLDILISKDGPIYYQTVKYYCELLLYCYKQVQYIPNDSLCRLYSSYLLSSAIGVNAL